MEIQLTLDMNNLDMAQVALLDNIESNNDRMWYLGRWFDCEVSFGDDDKVEITATEGTLAA